VNISWFEPLQAYWRALQARERLVLAVGGALAILMLGYTFLWAPVQRDLMRLRAAVPTQQAQLVRMQAHAIELQRLRQSAATVTDGGANLLTRLERSAQEHGLRRYITRMEPDGTSGVRVSLDTVQFNKMLAWLADLHRRSGVRAETATITTQSDPGIVNARLLLRTPGT
jgi:general secretion pathway protein M